MADVLLMEIIASHQLTDNRRIREQVAGGKGQEAENREQVAARRPIMGTGTAEMVSVISVTGRHPEADRKLITETGIAEMVSEISAADRMPVAARRLITVTGISGMDSVILVAERMQITGVRMAEEEDQRVTEDTGGIE